MSYVPRSEVDLTFTFSSQCSASFFCFAVSVLIVYSIIDNYGQPFRRGFFCNDESLMYPYRESTVDSSLERIGFGLPTAIIVITEFTRWKLSVDGNQQRVKLFNRDIPFWVVSVYKNVGLFLFGSFVSLLTTDIGKHALGRLRPHFMDVCQPIMSGGKNCSDPINFHRYIEDYACGNKESSEKRLKDMRLSFPSGHSSFSMFTMFFAAIYLQCRMTWTGSKLLKHLLQFVVIMLAWFTALSRISDYKHHCENLKFVLQRFA